MNALAPIEVSDCGNVSGPVSPVQLANALAPIEVSDSSAARKWAKPESGQTSPKKGGVHFS